ncbi:redoxin domain-containing protein [Paenibacillus sp. D2_2]|uniref:redoxin domain-containing protein n=1 Tax=Paenibacillus sp. D2_2 TaxID=3073092 RepID=UPI0028167F23|nr:redoxin domain-containing protein [Paenibacillus sp. D2_2]WMT43178.1 redoxin domain-containing protein [Paenibacillus sp. D2_2]
MQFGTFVLNIELLIYLIAGIIGVLAVRFRERDRPHQERLVSDAWNAVFLWLIVWKLSLILFDFKGVIQHPLSLVFFSGGLKGVLIASIVAVAYLFLRNYRRVRSWEAMLVVVSWGAGMAATAFLGFILLSGPSGVADYLGLAVSVTLLAFLLSPSTRIAAQSLGVVLIVVMLGVTILNTTGGKSVRQDQAAPDFELTDLDGKSVRLSDYRGKTVVMNFWATWCRVCQAEMPHMERFYQDQQNQDDVVVLSINATSQERSSDNVENYVDKEGLSFPIVLDKDGDVLKEYKVTAYPTTYIIDPSGNIRERYLGAVSFDSIKKAANRVD